MPPHVNLIGEGEYFINREKQGSVFDPGDLPGDDDEEFFVERKKRVAWRVFLGVVAVMVILFLMKLALDKVRKRNQKRAFMDRWNEEIKRLSDSDISLNNFEIDLDDVTLSE